MKLKTLFSILLLGFCSLQVNAQNDREKVEAGINQIERLIEGHNWGAAFEKLRSLETGVAMNNPELLYLTTKQRCKMYTRINHNREAAEQRQKMEQLALRSGNEKIIEDMLHGKASYYASKGENKIARECYEQMFYRRSAGKDDKGTEACFKSMIDEATKSHNNTMKEAVNNLYTAWQDSIAAVKASRELKDLKKQYAVSQEEIADKDSTIGFQKGAIIMLAIILAAVVAGICFLALVTLRHIRTSKRLRNDLKVSNENSEQKSILIRNIAGQISPSLQEIEKGGNTTQHINALNKMLSDVQTYVDLDDTKAEKPETESVNVSKLCEEAVAMCGSCRAAVGSDAPSINFTVAPETVRQVLCGVVKECDTYSGIENITLSFKKRNPHMGQFTITATGMRLTDEQKQTLFTAFAQVYDLTQTTGLAFPICSLMAYKMGASLSLDDAFAKGTRFILEVHC